VKNTKRTLCFLISLFFLFFLFSAGFNGCQKGPEKAAEEKKEGKKEESVSTETPSFQQEAVLPSGRVLVYKDEDESLNLLTFSLPDKESEEKIAGEPIVSGPLGLLIKSGKVKVKKEVKTELFPLVKGSWLGTLDPSGEKLYYSKKGALWRKDLSSGEEEKIVSLSGNNFPSSDLLLSPSGERLAFLAGNNPSKLAVVNLKSRSLKIYFPLSSKLAWLDEENLLFSDKNSLRSFNVLQGTENWTQKIVAKNLAGTFYALSPDSKRAVIFAEKEDGGGLFSLINLSDGNRMEVYKWDSYEGYPGSCSWLPDNKTLVLEIGGEDAGRFSIWFLDLEKGGKVKEIRSMATTLRAPVEKEIDYLHPLVSPDGNWLICTEAENVDWGNPPGNQDEKWRLVLFPLNDLSNKYVLQESVAQVISAMDWKR